MPQSNRIKAKNIPSEIPRIQEASYQSQPRESLTPYTVSDGTILPHFAFITQCFIWWIIDQSQRPKNKLSSLLWLDIECIDIDPLNHCESKSKPDQMKHAV